MSTLDLDALKSRWAAQSREVDQHLTLDIDAVRRRLGAHTVTALQRQKNSRVRALALGGAALAALAGFVAGNLHDLPYLLLALPFVLLLALNASVDLRELAALGQVDFAQPLAQLRDRYDLLRARRLQLALLIAQLSVLLWLPLIMLAAKGLIGIDLLRYLPLSYVASNVALGIVLIPLIALGVRWIARRRPDSPAWRRFADETAGRDWQRTSEHLDRQIDFERNLDGDAHEALQRAQAADLAPAVEAQRATARRRVSASLVLISVLILCTGGFNARHGGEAAALVPGVLLHLAAIVWLIATIVLHEALARPGAGTRRGDWQQRLRSVLRGYRGVLQCCVVAAPLLALGLLQVLGLALAATDLSQVLGLALPLGLGALAVLATALLYRRWRENPARFAAGTLTALGLGSLAAAQAALDAAVAADDTGATPPEAS